MSSSIRVNFASQTKSEGKTKMNTKKTKKTKKTDIVKNLLALSNKIDHTQNVFYQKAEKYLRSVIKKQKEEKIDLSDANIALYTNEDSEDYLEDLEYLYDDGDVSLAIGGYDYLLTDLDMSSVCRLVKWASTKEA